MLQQLLANKQHVKHHQVQHWVVVLIILEFTTRSCMEFKNPRPSQHIQSSEYYKPVFWSVTIMQNPYLSSYKSYNPKLATCFQINVTKDISYSPEFLLSTIWMLHVLTDMTTQSSSAEDDTTTELRSTIVQNTRG